MKICTCDVCAMDTESHKCCLFCDEKETCKHVCDSWEDEGELCGYMVEEEENDECTNDNPQQP